MIFISYPSHSTSKGLPHLLKVKIRALALKLLDGSVHFEEKKINFILNHENSIALPSLPTSPSFASIEWRDFEQLLLPQLARRWRHPSRTILS